MYTERGDAIEQEEREARIDTPILIGQLSFPGMPISIHIFEPKHVPSQISSFLPELTQ
jgi:hypothetical protein